MAQHAFKLTEAEIKKLQSKLHEEILRKTGRGISKRVINEEDVRIYNFREPDKFSKAQLQTLNMLFENFAREVSTYLTSTMQEACEVEVTSVEQKSFQEVLRNMSDLTILNILSMKPLEGQSILEISPDVMFGIIDRIFGGVGGVSTKIRDLTAIERRVATKIVTKMLNIMTMSLENLDKFDIKLDKIETNPQFIQQVAPPMEICVKINFIVKISASKNSGIINLVLPFIMLESLLPKLTSHIWFTKRKDNNESQKNTAKISNMLNDAVVDFIVEIGRTKLSLGLIEELVIGDVIPIDKKIDEPFECFVENKKIAMASSHVRKGKKVVKIQEVVEKK